ncbi:MAG TPA: hypothetical protein VK498_00185 [Ferruginibacter sp.]|nr:hypothetical protein [Ferruginibacter sp.]
MTGYKISLSNQQVYYRLVAFWVVCEAFAGGIMHGINFPFTGMIVSSLAVISIILIAWNVPQPSAILKATVIVAVFKLVLSPHSPPTAYIAVFFQGVMGEVLFANRRYFTASSILLAVLSLIESSIQRILVLVILYGNNFWNAVNVFIKKLIGADHTSNYSLLLAILYISLHAIAGLIVGYYGAKLAKRSVEWNLPPELIIEKQPDAIEPNKRKGLKKIKVIFILLWISLVALFIQSLIMPEQSILPPFIAVGILFRSFIVVLSWYVVVSPFIMMIIKITLKTQQEKHKHLLNEITRLIPETKYIFTKSWQLSKNKNSVSRLKLFMKIVLMNILSPVENNKT